MAGCNLRCKYCDTRYAYKDGELYSIESILAKIKKYSIRNVEITGGEPLLQSETVELLNDLLKQGDQVLLETNGSVSLSPVPEEVVKVMDIKTPDSGEVDSFMLENLECLNSNDNIKFVLSSRKDFDWSVEFCEEHNLYEKCELLFSAVKEELKYSDLCDWILEAGINVRFQPQLHKLIWPNQKRGV